MKLYSYKNWFTKLSVLAVCSLGAAACTPSESKPKYVAADAQICASADSLLQVLGRDCGVATRFGHQDATVYGHTWWNEAHRSDVGEVSGCYPAVYGWELGHIELGDSCSLDSVRFEDIRCQMIAADARGGINTVSWHLDNPVNGHSSWDMTQGTVHAILNDSLVQAHYVQDLQRLAHFFLQIRRPDGHFVPLLFRPFHEHSGSWFWWGKDFCSPKEYIALWKFTQKKLHDLGVHHLLYIYSPDYVSSLDDYLERYPGDDCIDIWGLDYYHREGAEGTNKYMTNAKKMLQFIAQEAQQRHKLYVFSETGSESLPINNWFTHVLAPVIQETHPAYVLVWRNAFDKPMHFFAPYPGHATADDFKTFCMRKDILMGPKFNEKK